MLTPTQRKLGDKVYRLNAQQKKHLALALKDLANVILASLVIYGILEKLIQWQVGIAGIGIAFVFLAVSLQLLSEKEES